MAFITTPGQLKQQGEFYQQLASLTRAGVTIVQAIDVLRRSPPNRRLGLVANRVGDAIVRGATFTEAMRSTGRALPEFDIALIEAGETSGRLAECFRLLGEFYTERGRLASKVISALLYPIFLVHFALLIFPINRLTGLVLQGQTAEYFLNKATVLLPAYAAVLFLIWSLQSKRGRRWRNTVEELLHMLPVISKIRRDLALARLCAALESLINAGVTIIEAWDIAAPASGSNRIERAVAEAKPRLLQGETPSEVIATQGIYPDLFTSGYRTGEISGQLDDTLRRLYRHYMETATENLQRVVAWTPKLVFIGVAIGIGYQIIKFWSGYFDQINQLTQ